MEAGTYIKGAKIYQSGPALRATMEKAAMAVAAVAATPAEAVLAVVLLAVPTAVSTEADNVPISTGSSDSEDNKKGNSDGNNGNNGGNNNGPPNGVPDNYVKSPTKKGDGDKYTNPDDPHDNVRDMPGNPQSPNPAQQNPYVKQMRDGKAINKQGDRVEPNSSDAHIPRDEFMFHP